MASLDHAQNFAYRSQERREEKSHRTWGAIFLHVVKILFINFLKRGC